jgi:hypothetical protein
LPSVVWFETKAEADRSQQQRAGWPIGTIAVLLIVGALDLPEIVARCRSSAVGVAGIATAARSSTSRAWLPCGPRPVGMIITGAGPLGVITAMGLTAASAATIQRRVSPFPIGSAQATTPTLRLVTDRTGMDP